ncbi:amidohydrolase/deacetylase family metallohydrolase [Dyadobacter sandarakinus]|uniref:Amidohydrolase/deacetylase family metallohydrolase n=1 Tax=Dyadobacter sandarakinus TaxID=2747268 RepID=A0ABX7I9I5_9BACT|nr:amidohydrolase/deacetylase family metallohydrolase [Dyadobacter sandarakinus]QRR01626.1 amidohydrolase/deacetylase family metallohydrolase [Dyadobacter sandarakinus]
MKVNALIMLALLCILFKPAWSQEKKYSILIKGGHVLDPKNNIDAVMDVAIEGTPGGDDGKIAAVAKNIDPALAAQIVDAKGLYVTPGLIDIHVHFFWGTDLQGTYRNGPNALPADGFTFRSGVTTVVDAGSSGWKTFETFKKQTIDLSKTRVLAMLNIVGEGMAGGKFENSLDEMDAAKTAEMAKKYPNDVVGVKLAHFSGHDWTPTDRAIEAARLADIPIMVDFGSANPVLSLEELYLKKFRAGDIYTHCFGGNSNNSGRGRESIVDVSTNKVKPYVLEARKKGVIFDVGFGGASFLLAQGQPAIKQGFYPNSISTDLHTSSMNGPMKDMNNIMSLFMAMGMDFKSVITASTWNPAREIKRENLGNLSVGSVADVAVLNLRDGDFGFYARDGKIKGKKRIETEATIKGGSIVYMLNARVEPVNLPRPEPARK